jgi:hypothetical protein
MKFKISLMDLFTGELKRTSKVQGKKSTISFEKLTKLQIKEIMHQRLDSFIDDDMLIEFTLKIEREP